jgi:phage nucleotide-binding protein
MEVEKAASQASIKHQVKSVGSKINRGCSFIIYCDPGIGKTTMATTLPIGETLFINAEAGLGPLLGTGHDVFPKDGYDVKWLDDLESVYQWLRTEKHKYKNVVIDNISDIEQRLIQELTEKRKKETPELREYGDVAFKIREHCSNFRDLVHIGMNVVFNAWENTESIKTDAGSVVTRTYPKLSHKVAIEICGKVDVVGHLEVHEKSGKRWVRFGPSDQYITKSQFQGLDAGEPADFPLILQKIYAYDYKQGEK